VRISLQGTLKTQTAEGKQNVLRPSSTTGCFGLGPWTIHEEVFEDELALSSLERATASAAYDLAIWRRVSLGTNKLVLGLAVWAVEAGRF
jgi:hypothetical protein